MRAGFGNHRERYSNVRLETCFNKIFNSFNMTKELQVLVLSWLPFLSQKQTQLLFWVAVSKARNQLLSTAPRVQKKLPLHDLHRVQPHRNLRLYRKIPIPLVLQQVDLKSAVLKQVKKMHCPEAGQTKTLSCKSTFLQCLNKYTVLAADKARRCVPAGALLQQAKQMLCLTAGGNLAAAQWCLTWLKFVDLLYCHLVARCYLSAVVPLGSVPPVYHMDS